MKAADADVGTISVAVPVSRQIIYLIRIGAGIAVIISCLEAGIFIQRHLPIPVPGGVLGMVLLFVLLQTKVVPDAWVRDPCTWLLLLLPVFFVPLFALPLSDPNFLSQYGTRLLPAAIVAAAITLSMTGWVARRTQRR